MILILITFSYSLQKALFNRDLLQDIFLNSGHFDQSTNFNEGLNEDLNVNVRLEGVWGSTHVL